MRPRTRRARLAGLGLLVGLPVLWTLVVHWCWYDETCLACGHGRTVFEDQVGTLTIRTTIASEHPTAIGLVAEDLGTPCRHERADRVLKQRWLGLWLPRIGHRGTTRLADEPWYPPCARDAVRSWARDDPDLARTFREQVLEDFDPSYLRRFVLRLYDACPPDQLPARPIGAVPRAPAERGRAGAPGPDRPERRIATLLAASITASRAARGSDAP